MLSPPVTIIHKIREVGPSGSVYNSVRIPKLILRDFTCFLLLGLTTMGNYSGLIADNFKAYGKHVYAQPALYALRV